jgi:hypothetical protein
LQNREQSSTGITHVFYWILGALTSTLIDHLLKQVSNGSALAFITTINMGIDSTVHSLLQPPPNVGHTPHTNISEEDAKLVKAVEEHFGKEGYQLPIKEDATEMAALTEREMMFLVRQLFRSLGGDVS